MVIRAVLSAEEEVGKCSMRVSCVVVCMGRCRGGCVVEWVGFCPGLQVLLLGTITMQLTRQCLREVLVIMFAYLACEVVGWVGEEVKKLSSLEGLRLYGRACMRQQSRDRAVRRQADH